MSYCAIPFFSIIAHILLLFDISNAFPNLMDTIYVGNWYSQCFIITSVIVKTLSKHDLPFPETMLGFQENRLRYCSQSFLIQIYPCRLLNVVRCIQGHLNIQHGLKSETGIPFYSVCPSLVKSQGIKINVDGVKTPYWYTQIYISCTFKGPEISDQMVLANSIKIGLHFTTSNNYNDNFT